ncbi:MAG: YSC84-related protein [Moraxellaceae bacterium]|nr:YSC84-related protein [Moraxellaceae bacterium]MDZ4298547.1 YSC84-related protein [Moraxellaceae bacterium]MDZ4386830.1 YSC84-related protein [Moraxellaceae bacterium]
MKTIKPIALSIALGLTAISPLMLVTQVAYAASAEDLNRDAAQALEKLYKTNPVAADLGKRAHTVLVFPNIVKAGLIFGGSYGEGVHFKAGKVANYYNSVSASWGLQAGAQSYGYAMFLMNETATNFLERSKGWEVGVGPTVVVVNEGVAASLNTTTLSSDAYAFVFDQQGLMASLSIEGSKISVISR